MIDAAAFALPLRRHDVGVCAAHVVEVMCAIRESAAQGRPVELEQAAESFG